MKKNLLLVTIATLGLTASTMAQNLPNYVPANGLVGWWPFSGNANDESVNMNNGTVNGASLSTDRFGNSNSAYSFDGITSYIEVLHNSSQNLTNTVSFSLWINSTDFNLNGQTARAPLGKRRTSNSPGLGFETLDNVGSCCGPQFYLNNNTGSGGLDYENSTSLEIGIWTHLVGTYDGNTLKLYKNSTLLGSSIGTISLTSTVQNLYFGREGNTSPNRNFKGLIDDIGFWNRALTQQEITDLYNGNICYQTITVTDTLLINMGIIGFNPVNYDNTIKIFPNPTNDHITIDFGNYTSLNGYQIVIENSLGQQMFQTAINQQTSYISLSSWSGNGLYFVHIIDSQGNTIDIRKIVIQ